MILQVMRNFARPYIIRIFFIACCTLYGLLVSYVSRAQDGNIVFGQEVWHFGFPDYDKKIQIDTLIDRAMQLSGPEGADNARLLLLQALDLSKRWHYREGTAKAQVHLGYIFLLKDDLKQSRAYFLEALPYLQRTASLQRILAKVYDYLGTVYVRQGLRDTALKYYYRSLDVAGKLAVKDTMLIATVYSNIVGGVFMGYAGYAGKKDQVLYYLNLARPMAIALGEKGRTLLANIYVNMGMAYDRLEGDTALALVNYRLGIDQLRAIQEGRGHLQYAYTLVAAMYLDRKIFEQAKLYIDSAIAVYKEGFASSIQLNQVLASYLREKKDYRRSLFYYNRAMDICDNIGADNFKLTIYYFRAQTLSGLGLGRQAYEDQKRHSDLLDILMSRQRIEAVNEMEARYRTVEKDKALLQSQLRLRQKEADIREKGLWAGGISVCMLFALVAVVSRQRNRQKLLAHQQEIALLNSKMQGEDLERSRIARELHDGVSVLLSAAKMNFSAIGKENPLLTQTDAFKEVGTLLNQTVQEVRSISHNLVPGLLIHQSLPAAVQAFCELIRKGYGLQVELLSYGSFTATDKEWNYAIYRMVQELVHNVIKHAQATEILIQLTIHEDKLHLTVEDDGIGFAGEKPRMGLGLQSLRQRVTEMQGHFIFSSRPSEGTTVEIEVPVITL